MGSKSALLSAKCRLIELQFRALSIFNLGQSPSTLIHNLIKTKKIGQLSFLSSSEHHETDFKAIHFLICDKIAAVRQVSKSAGSEAEIRERNKQLILRQKEILDIARPQAQKLLFESQYALAIPASLLTLKFSLVLYGQDRLELVSAYLLLGEAFIGLKQYNQAEEYLTLARWCILKTAAKDPTLQYAVSSQLHRNFGMLYQNQGNLDAAAENFAQSIYYSALMHGPEHIAVTGGYYKLGSVLEQLGKVEEASAFYEKVVDIWSGFCQATSNPSLLEKVLASNSSQLLQKKKEGMDASSFSSALLDRAQQAEVISILAHIYQFREKKLQSSPMKSAECQIVLAKLYAYCRRYQEARQTLFKAIELYETHLGHDHQATDELRAFSKSVLKELSLQSKA